MKGGSEVTLFLFIKICTGFPVALTLSKFQTMMKFYSETSSALIVNFTISILK